ncbi:Uncharacterised protein [Zhongshania aliphaticivorans]|uniref:Uncharacterized protein n=1 Tax=Zhongshania aliphaticivorans TaxID=1470434 RepID=A0A5S9QHY5_9GAMM|nr:Uncharacterised protein [Zhongshania aliphaticivorans]CAA0118358.1 Uncharacterised protein [Zhongshania aliphaticivorans]CAA0122380.1 Uncharacterised protein [Zhongshania aliphaticivorans]
MSESTGQIIGEPKLHLHAYIMLFMLGFTAAPLPGNSIV